jgi:DUF438 domain-containing protein
MTDSDMDRPGPNEPTRESPVSARQTWDMSTDHLAALLDALPLDLTFVGTDGRIRYYNHNIAKVYPRSTELIGQRVQDCHGMTQVVRQQVDDILRALVAGESAERVTVRREAERILHVRYIRVLGPGGECIGILQLTQDLAPLAQYLEADVAWATWK